MRAMPLLLRGEGGPLASGRAAVRREGAVRGGAGGSAGLPLRTPPAPTAGCSGGGGGEMPSAASRARFSRSRSAAENADELLYLLSAS